MKLDDCFNRIDKYLNSDDYYPLLVNVNNTEDMNHICSHYSLGSVSFKTAEDFSNNKDENIFKPNVLDFLKNNTENTFLTGLTCAFRLQGIDALKDILVCIAQKECRSKAVVLCYQCENELNFYDDRLVKRVCLVDGTAQKFPELEFCSTIYNESNKYVDGIDKVGDFIEKNDISTLYVKTKKIKSDYMNSILTIVSQGNAYSQLCERFSEITKVSERVASDEQWNYALNVLTSAKSFSEFVESRFTNMRNLDKDFHSLNQYDENTKWMYFLALKCYGTPQNKYLNIVLDKTKSFDKFKENIYRSLISVNYDDKDFWKIYEQRKQLIHALDNESEQDISEYCKQTRIREEYAIYYLTDASEKEKNFIFECLSKYHEKYKKDEVLSVLKKVYPALYSYLKPYDYKNDLLNRYFNEYKYEKVTNHITHEFLSLVEEQSSKREYNAILPSRSEKTEGLANEKTHIYFIDAMGVEYISYILDKCHNKNLLVKTTICHGEVPTLTYNNKDFIDVFKKDGANLAHDEKGFKRLDDIKHRGVESFFDYDLEEKNVPFYISEELRIFDELLTEVENELHSSNFDKVILVSDHGASRLAVIGKQEVSYEMKEKGKHSGRCCPKQETDEVPECATDGGNYWVLANYGCFEGGRAATIETHGGATLEEIVVPIIEITLGKENFELELESTSIEFTRRKKDAKLKLFSKTKLEAIVICIEQLDLKKDVTSDDGHNFTIELPELLKEGTYTMDVYYGDNLIKSDIEFTAKSKAGKIKDLGI